MAKMVDRVKAAMAIQDRIRNIAICAHIDHGKTTFSDNLLAGAGMMSEDLAGKACVLDFHEDGGGARHHDRQRGSSAWSTRMARISSSTSSIPQVTWISAVT